MYTQVTFTAEKNLKNQALRKAKNEGYPLKTVLVYALKGFVNNQITFGLTERDTEPEVELIKFTDKKLKSKAAKLARLLA
ncbi:MAG: hypothetical protein Q7K39_03750 [Candidatus Magasanikbacteria bacterium]|nr:hypothetical protein [Candidatus Magasanikbacteria bacterium]